jgi:hypothetical protein
MMDKVKGTVLHVITPPSPETFRLPYFISSFFDSLSACIDEATDT